MQPVIKPALLLDLDRTVRRSKSDPNGFIKDENDIELMPGIEKVIWRYSNMGFLIFGVTNQGGIAHGHKTPAQFYAELDRTMELFSPTTPFNSIQACFFMEGGSVPGYNRRSLLRKPEIGMLAVLEYEGIKSGVFIDWDNSLFVGDQEEDRQVAGMAGIDFMYVDDFIESPHVFTVTDNGPRRLKNEAEIIAAADNIIASDEDVPAPASPEQAATPEMSPIPETLDEVVDAIVQDIQRQGAEDVVKEHGIPHHGAGTSIRNFYHLWWSEQLRDDVLKKDPNSDYPKERPALVSWFNERGICHADDMSGIISDAVKARLNRQPFDFEAAANRYFEYWKKQGYKDGIFKQENLVRPSRHWIRHMVNEMDDSLCQRCFMCGEIMSDYRNASLPAGQEPPKGFPAGDVYLAGTNPKQYAVVLPNGDTFSSCLLT